eukprot:gene1238-1401_t
MHGLGINGDRALLFIQALSTDFRLEVDQFIYLQRLWQSGPNPNADTYDPASGSSPAHVRGGSVSFVAGDEGNPIETLWTSDCTSIFPELDMDSLANRVDLVAITDEDAGITSDEGKQSGFATGLQAAVEAETKPDESTDRTVAANSSPVRSRSLRWAAEPIANADKPEGDVNTNTMSMSISIASHSSAEGCGQERTLITEGTAAPFHSISLVTTTQSSPREPVASPLVPPALRKSWGLADSSIVEDYELMSIEAKKRVARLSHRMPISGVRCLPSGQSFVSACEEGKLCLWRLPRARDSMIAKQHTKSGDTTTSSLDRSSNWSNSINILSRRRLCQVNEDLEDHDFVIVAGDKCGGVRVYGGKNNVRDLKELFARDVPDMGHVTCMGFQQLAKGGSEKRRQNSNDDQDKPPPPANTSSRSASSVVSRCKSVTGFDLRTKPKLFYVLWVGWSTLGMGGSKGAVCALDMSTGQTTCLLSKAHTAAVSGIIPVRHQELLSCSFDRTIRLWDLRARSCGVLLEGGNASVTAIAVSESNDSVLVAASA